LLLGFLPQEIKLAYDFAFRAAGSNENSETCLTELKLTSMLIRQLLSKQTMIKTGLLTIIL
jgi:hypothetical protein